jgi:hypothetical protein
MHNGASVQPYADAKVIERGLEASFGGFLTLGSRAHLVSAKIVLSINELQVDRG